MEDDEDLVYLLEYNLSKKGYTTMAALDGLDACCLIENAIKYSPEKTGIRVNLLSQGENTVMVEVKDTATALLRRFYPHFLRCYIHPR